MFNNCTKEDYQKFLMDSEPLVGRKVLCVKERGKDLIGARYGYILKPDSCNGETSYKSVEDFEAKCEKEFSDSNFTVVSHGYDRLDGYFTWSGDYKNFEKTWELD